MANDKSIELRVALQEHQMATAVEILEEIRENYVTKDHLEERLSHCATKDDIVRLDAKLGETTKDIQRLDAKLGETSKDIQRHDAKLGEISKDIQRHDAKLGEISKDIQRLDAKLDETSKDIQRLDAKLDENSKDIAGLAAQMVVVQQDIVRIDEKLGYFAATFATKADLERMNQGMRNWIITVGVSITALQFAMQYALFQLYAHVR